MKRDTCSACGNSELVQFLDLGTSPIADAYTDKPDPAAARHPLQVAVCTSCMLVQLTEVLDGKTLFGSGYSFYSSASPPLSRYHSHYASSVIRRYRHLLELGVVEVGCNDGDLLRHFADWPHLGVDPAEGPAVAAQERGLNVLIEPFGADSARAIVAERGRQGVVIANHVLAHVEDVADVLDGISTLLTPDGVAIIEVQYLPDLLVNNAFDLFYHEHRNFFSLTSLGRAAQRAKLWIVDSELTDRQGGSLRVTLIRDGGNPAWHDLPVKSPGRLGRLANTEGWLDSLGAYEGMQGRAERIRDRLVNLLMGARAGGVVAGYGAPAKATTLYAFCGIDQPLVRYITDTTEAKQGRYLPGTEIPIVARGDRMPEVFVVNAWNYLPRILRNEKTFRDLGGQFVVPFPAPVLL